MTEQDQGEFTGPSDSPRLFRRIAHRYDTMNRLMSLGQDRHWRRLAAEVLDVPPRGQVLDVGVGTGDMALALKRRWPEATVVGVDPTREMMQVGKEKLDSESGSAGRPPGWAQADGLRLPFPDEAFDGVVSAFVLRNVVDVAQAMAEQRRVVREGGQVVCLEMSWPRTPVFGALFRFYFANLMPRITGLLTGQRAAYRYLPRSVERFQTPEELRRTMGRVGLRDIRHQELALGTVTLHVGARAE